MLNQFLKLGFAFNSRSNLHNIKKINLSESAEICEMSKIDELYNSLTAEQKTLITKEQFFQGILQIEMEKLREMGLFNTMALSPQETRDLIFNKLKKNYNNLIPEGSQRCMHNYCRSHDVKASHVISEAALRLICGKAGKQDNVLYTPKTDMNSSQLGIISLGVGKAFRFPGFCEKHENWFDFEKEIEIVNEKQAYKQIFRSICYDLYLQGIFLKQEKLLSQLILEKLKEKATSLIREHTILEIELTGYRNLETKKMLARLTRSIKRTNHLLAEYRSFKREVWRAFQEETKNVYLWQGQIPARVPIAFTHCGGINITDKNKRYRVFGAIILMPLSKGSRLLFCTPSKYKKYLNYLLRSFNQRGYLEHFILHALAGLTDNWLVNPVFWDNDLSEIIKKEILAKKNWVRPE
jgi:hypothetical protein